MWHSQDSVKACAEKVTASNEEDRKNVEWKKYIIAKEDYTEIPLDELK